MLGQLSRAEYPVDGQTSVSIRDLPQTAQELAENMRKCQKWEGILSPDSKDMMKPHLDDINDERVFSDKRRLVGTTPSCDALVHIIQQANAKKHDRAAERAWNCDVHGPLLKIALRHSIWQKELRCDNV